MSITLNGTTGITTPAIDNQGNLTVDGGTIKLDGNYPVGTGNVALGDLALSDGSLSGGNNTAVGYNSGANIASGAGNTLTGSGAGVGITTGTNNSYFGVGTAAFDYNTGTANVGLGYQALYKITTASNSTAVGYQAGYGQTTGGENSFFGRQAGYSAAGSTATHNTFIGDNAGSTVTTGSKNTILGRYNGNQGGLDIRTSNNNIVLSDGDGNPRMWVYNGYSNFSNTTSWQSGGINAHSFEQNDVAQDILHLRHPAVSGGYGLLIKLDGSPNNTTNYFIQAADASAAKFRVYSNGNVVNTNNSYGSISDVKLKENIVDSGSQWDDIKALTVRKYSMKADNLDAPNMLGVIAQEVEIAGMGGLVITSPDLDPETKEDLGTVTKQVNYSILYMKAVKALQEAMDRIETLEAQNASFEARITALEGN
jgi:hypothetical protein